MEKKDEEEKIAQLQKEKEKEELQRIEREEKEREEELATTKSRPLAEHEELTSSVSIPEIEEIILNHLELKADPLIVPTVPSVEETKEETATPVISTISLSVSLYFIKL